MCGWWIFVGALAGILTVPRGIHGACIYEGALHANNTSWRPQSCQECTCYGDVAICGPTHCPNPHCDLQRGEHLRIPTNKCCPECASSSQGSCQYEGVIYGVSDYKNVCFSFTIQIIQG
ncbi:extracellular matrix organizing protein FRAS1-like isoform X2 [Simochromis diagramma]|uniref:extracellular matrix organizing protein FRAS1-like isoform X2 n=1 Tax=Simochromis diagramma TaxID=43689 RepID=UPI001A7EAD49|nr:extracellular matrix organizing protein FRAS1-like isoform X2 [Simochromis diagramma]